MRDGGSLTVLCPEEPWLGPCRERVVTVPQQWPEDSRTLWVPRLGLCRPPPLGTDRLLSEASGLPLLAVQPSSCGHCPVLEADSARPVEPSLPSAQAPHPLASRTLNTFCFERKQTLWKLPLGAQTASLAPSFGGWRTSQAFQGKLASEATCGLAAPHPGGGRVGS